MLARGRCLTSYRALDITVIKRSLFKALMNMFYDFSQKKHCVSRLFECTGLYPCTLLLKKSIIQFLLVFLVHYNGGTIALLAPTLLHTYPPFIPANITKCRTSHLTQMSHTRSIVTTMYICTHILQGTFYKDKCNSLLNTNKGQVQ